MVEFTLRYTFPAAFSILGPAFDSIEARAMLIAIGLQESRFIHRAQVGGPARGFWQFERGGGVVGVLAHPKTSALAFEALAHLKYHKVEESSLYYAALVHEAIEHNDVLAAVFARLLLYTVPGKLPQRFQKETAWAQYIQGWRPGAYPWRPGEPVPALSSRWSENYRKAWDAVI